MPRVREIASHTVWDHFGSGSCFRSGSVEIARVHGPGPVGSGSRLRIGSEKCVAYTVRDRSAPGGGFSWDVRLLRTRPSYLLSSSFLGVYDPGTVLAPRTSFRLGGEEVFCYRVRDCLGSGSRICFGNKLFAMHSWG